MGDSLGIINLISDRSIDTSTGRLMSRISMWASGAVLTGFASMIMHKDPTSSASKGNIGVSLCLFAFEDFSREGGEIG